MTAPLATLAMGGLHHTGVALFFLPFTDKGTVKSL